VIGLITVEQTGALVDLVAANGKNLTHTTHCLLENFQTALTSLSFLTPLSVSNSHGSSRRLPATMKQNAAERV
jgi:hypothetical protein